MSKDLHGLDPPADVETVHIAEIQNLDSPPTPSFEDEKELAAIEAKYSPSEEALQLPPGAGGEGDDAFAAQPSIFDDPDLRKFYWPRHNYENIHRFFPDFKWTVGEERRLIRKIDWRITSWCCFMFFALQLDRGNITQANSDNFLVDLGLTTNQYNYGQTIFYLSFLLAEIPSQLVSKKIGPDNWIPIQMILWSIVAASQSRLSGEASFYATRALLGLLEGGFIPDIVLYMSYFFKGKELPNRLALFWSSYITTQIVAAFLAYGIFHINSSNGWASWRWLFLIEGVLTGIIGLVSWAYLPPGPTQTASWFRGRKGWFSEREEIILVTRVVRDDPSKGDMHNRQAITLRKMWRCLTDYDMWILYIIGLTWAIPFTPPTAYLTLILRSLGFSTLNTNLLTIPSLVLMMLQLLLTTWVSEKVKGNHRMEICAYAQIWALIFLIPLIVFPNSEAAWTRYAILTLLLGYPYIHAIQVGLQSRNANSVRTRTVASAAYNMMVQLGNIVSSNIYRADDAPYYRRGNKMLVGIACLNLVLYAIAKGYYVWKNKKRARIWNNWTEEERKEYVATTKDRGNKRLDFQFAH